jgi:hypothetical protein
MANIFDGFLKQIATGDSIKDYKHASRLFVDNNYARSPKYDWLYHVFFDVDPTISNIDKDNIARAGMLVKSVSLPNYDVDLRVQNNYNKKELIQTKLNYGAITFTFHDDQSEIVRNLWYDYYTHYFRDNDGGYSDRSGHIAQNYHANNKYQPGSRDFYDKFGYSPKKDLGPALPRYFTSIRVYSLHQKRFSEYTLLNPVITQFAHGTHNASGGGILEHQMTVSFTTVLYAGGNVSQATVAGFADLHYDKSPSPLTPAGGGTNSILGPGGILSAVDSIVGEAGGGNFGAAAFTAFRAFNKNKNVDLKGLAKGELIQITKDVLSQNDPRNRFFIPSSGALASTGLFGKGAVSGVSGGITEFTQKRSATTGSIASNGGALPGLPGANAITSQIQSKMSGFPASSVPIGGIMTAGSGLISGAPVNKVLNFGQSAFTGGIGALQSVSTSPEFSGFAGKLGEIGKGLAGTVGAVADQATRGLSGIANGLVAAAPSVARSLQTMAPTFLAGTSTIANSFSNTLSQTPFGNMNIPKQSAVASMESAKFIESGNKTDLVFGQRVATATNPAPTQTAGINLGGSIPA